MWGRKLIFLFVFKHHVRLLLCFYIASLDAKEIYEIRADDLMAKLLTNVYKGKYQGTIPTFLITMVNSSKTYTQNKRKMSVFTTVNYVATKHFVSLERHPENMTLEQFSYRKREIDLMTVFDSPIRHIPNFRSQDDEITNQTRRFNNIQNSEVNENILREHYFDYMNGTRTYIEKKRMVSLMAQFVYETRYQLTYAQNLRRKYRANVRYQLGYCFALLNTLKVQQRIMYNTLINYYKHMSTLYTHLKFYEKIVKLDVDIKDLMKLIQHLSKIRKRNADAMEEQNKAKTFAGK